MCSGVIGVMLPAECWNYTEDCMLFPVQRQTDRSGKLWERGEYRTDYQVVHKEEPVEIFNAELADADVIDRTYQEMLSLLTLMINIRKILKKRADERTDQDTEVS